MPTFQELEVFVVVAEQGSLSAAARLLNLSQPSISQIVQALETRLRVDLFTRHRRGVRLTDAGTALLPMAQEVLNAVRHLRETMAQLHGEVVGRLQIGCSTASGKYVLPGLVARFRQDFPQVRVDVLIRGRESALELLTNGKIAFAVSSKRVEHSDLEYLPFLDDEVQLIVSAAHPWARFGRILPDDLLDIPLIMREAHSGTVESVYRGLLEHGITPDMLNVVMELGNAEAIVMAVEEGIGGAFVSRTVAQRGAALGNVVVVQVEGMRLQHQICIARTLRYPASRAQAELWSFVEAESANLLNNPTPQGSVVYTP